MLNGQAAVNHQQLTLLGEGLVTVRTIHPGSQLWLSASADQTFTVLPVETQPKVVIDPPKPDGTFSLEIRAPEGGGPRSRDDLRPQCMERGSAPHRPRRWLTGEAYPSARPQRPSQDATLLDSDQFTGGQAVLFSAD